MLEPQQEQWRIREIASSSWDVEGRQCNPSQLHLSGNIQDQASAPLPQPRVFSRRLISRAPGDLQHSRSNYLSRIRRVPAHLYKSSPDFWCVKFPTSRHKASDLPLYLMIIARKQEWTKRRTKTKFQDLGSSLHQYPCYRQHVNSTLRLNTRSIAINLVSVTGWE